MSETRCYASDYLFQNAVGLAKQFSRVVLMKPIWRAQGVQKGKIIGKIGKP
jgi:hypothetical protein|tara:strand:- start:1232 stop:1384 length:153 start_codon:yes stop_codon:yes gene_type:complete